MVERIGVRIFQNVWFARFASRERIDARTLVEAVRRAERGQIDADLGGGVIKQRVARSGQGRSGGYRTLLFYRRGDRAVFVFGFAKRDRENISTSDLADLKQAARVTMGLSSPALDRLVEAGKLLEIVDDETD